MSTKLKLHSRPNEEFLVVRSGGKNTRVKPILGGEPFLVDNSDIIPQSQTTLTKTASSKPPQVVNKPRLSIGQRVLRPSSSPEHDYQYLIGTITEIQGALVKINNRTLIHESNVTVPPPEIPLESYTEDAEPFPLLHDTTNPFEPLPLKRHFRTVSRRN
jgi:hypothetical protein